MKELIVINQNGQLVIDSREVAQMVNIIDKILNELQKVDIKDKALDKLEEICIKSFLVENKLGLTFELDELPFNFRHRYPFIIQAITTQIYHNHNSCLQRESDMKESFISKLKEYLPSASLMSKTNNSKHQPDLWLLIEGVEVPVEIKKTSFNEKALKQLQRYMFIYKCKSGIAIAKNLKCDLPTNITFIQFNE